MAPLAPAAPLAPVPGVVSGEDARALRPAAVAALEKARARLASLDEVARTISFPSVEMLIEDADRRAAAITNPARDFAFVERQLQTARAYAERLAAGEDPYRDRGLHRHDRQGVPRRFRRDAAALRGLPAARR